jgi:hypothetical protein
MYANRPVFFSLGSMSAARKNPGGQALGLLRP